MKNARPAAGERQTAEISLAQFIAPLEEPDGNEKVSIGKKGATQLRYRATLQQPSRDGQTIR